MPTYEYVCAKCDHRFEKFQLITAKPLRVCPKELCGMRQWGKGKVTRLIGAGAGLLFKGSGFYITDYRSPSYTEAAKKESGATTPAADSKPAAGSAPAPAKPAPSHGTRPEPRKPKPASKPDS